MFSTSIANGVSFIPVSTVILIVLSRLSPKQLDAFTVISYEQDSVGIPLNIPDDKSNDNPLGSILVKQGPIASTVPSPLTSVGVDNAHT